MKRLSAILVTVALAASMMAIPASAQSLDEVIGNGSASQSTQSTDGDFQVNAPPFTWKYRHHKT